MKSILEVNIVPESADLSIPVVFLEDIYGGYGAAGGAQGGAPRTMTQREMEQLAAQGGMDQLLQVIDSQKYVVDLHRGISHSIT